MDIFSVLSLFGGLALFLFGMQYMGSGLEKASGGKLEKLLEKMTDNPIKGVLLGVAHHCRGSFLHEVRAVSCVL